MDGLRAAGADATGVETASAHGHLASGVVIWAPARRDFIRKLEVNI